jgi:hypothetical protein
MNLASIYGLQQKQQSNTHQHSYLITANTFNIVKVENFTDILSSTPEIPHLLIKKK